MSHAVLPDPTSRHSTHTQTGSPSPEEHSERSGNEEFSRKSPELELGPGEEEVDVDSPLPRNEQEEEEEKEEQELVEGPTNHIVEDVNNSHHPDSNPQKPDPEP